MVSSYEGWILGLSAAAGLTASCVAVGLASRLATARRALNACEYPARQRAAPGSPGYSEQGALTRGATGSGTPENETRFYSAFDFAAIGMAIVSPEGRWIQVNRAVCQIVGYSSEELRVLTFQDITHPDDLDADMGFVHRVLSGEIDRYEMEKRYLHKQGQVVWVLLSVTLVRSTAGTPLHFLSQIQDISARKAAEHAVHVSEERFQLVVNGTLDGIWDWDMLSGHCYYSPRYLELLGYTDDEVDPTRHAFESWLHPEDREGTSAALHAHLDHQVPYSLEYRLRCKSGQYIWFHARGQACWDHRGKPIRFTGSVRDIRSAREFAEKLRKNSELLRQTGRLAKIGGWERDLLTNIPIWSQEVRAILGVGPDYEATPESGQSFYAPETKPLMQEAIRAVAEEGKSFELEVAYITAQGRSIWVRVQGQAEMRGSTPVRIFGTLQDITEYKQTELALERSQKFLDAVIEAIPQPLFVKDAQHRWVLFNQYFCEMVGRERNELLGRSDPDIYPAEVAARFWAEDDEALSIDQPMFVESQIVRPDGSTRWLWKSKRRVDLPDGRYIVGISTDITRLKEIQEALARSEESHRLLAEHSSDMISRMTPDGTLTYLSAASIAVLGYAPEALLGQGVAEFIHPDDREAALRLYWEVVRDDVVNVVTCRLRRADGSWTWTETSFRAMRDPATRRTIHVIGVSRNVDDRIKAGEALNRFKHALDNTIDMIFMFDSRTLRLSYVNKGATTTLGYSEECLLAMHVWELRGNVTESEYRAFIEPFLCGEIQSRQFETVHRCADDSLIPVDASMQLVRQPGEEHGLFISITRSAVERKNVERMKSEFVSTVSHELRTPLTSIRGSLGLIAGGAVGELSEQARKLVSIAYNNSERLVRLINDILDMEKIESGKMRFELQPHRIRPLLEQAVEATRPYAEQLRVQLQLRGALSDTVVPLDSDRFMQVMANLLSNAAKFSPPGGTVEVATEHRGGSLRILVTDRGPGIPANFRSKIFGKFSQADSSDSRQKGGTGLGLSIVKSIMEKHGGEVGFETQIGRGTTFHVSFPLAAPIARAKEHRGETSVSRVLVCEDEPEVALTIGATLRSAGFVPDIARTLAEARTLLRTQHYAAMTLDLTLPDGDGIDLLREVSGNPDTAGLPIVVVSANTDGGRLRLSGGATPLAGWLSKPLDGARLLEVVRGGMRAAPHLRPRILHVEDDTDVREIVSSIARGVADFDWAVDLSDARAKLRTHVYSLVILDLELPDGSGWDLLSELNQLETAPPVVIFSAQQVDARHTHAVAAALTKSNASNEELLAIIKRVAGHSAPMPVE